MEILVERFDKPELERINKVRHYKKIYWASQLVEANGWTVNGSAMGHKPGVETTMDFPLQQPTSGDFSLWETAVISITSPSLELSPPLGKALNDGHDTVLWWKGTSEVVYRSEIGQSRTTAYRLDGSKRATRSSTLLIEDKSVIDDPPSRKRSLVSVRFTTDGQPCYHSECLYKVHPYEGGQSPMDRIHESEYRSLFQHAIIPEDGRWITEGLQRGTIVSVHDGSYQEEVDPSVSSTALVIYCTHSNKQGIVPLAERTDVDTASNYRGEALGALLNAVLLRACTHRTDITYKPIRTGCDNMGIVKHAANFKSALPDKQQQADVLRSMRANLQKLPMAVTYEHVMAHQDETRGLADLNLLERLNVVADKWADRILLQAVSTQSFISPDFPGEGIRAYCAGKKLRTSVKTGIYEAWGETIARELMKERGIADSTTFDKVAWDAVKNAMLSFTSGFSSFVTKFVSHFGGTNKMLSNWQEVDNRCPSCGMQDESMSHITRCREEGRVQMRTESAYALAEWLVETDMDDELAEGLLDYVIGGGDVKLQDILDDDSQYQDYAKVHDRLGWDSFLEGRISTALLEIQKDCLFRAGSYWKIKAWSRHFIHHLLSITHRQWLYRNARVHLKKVEGRTLEEHEKVRDEVRSILSVQPEDLLPCHQELLRFDLESLGSGSTRDRILWLNRVEAAIAAKKALDKKQKGIERRQTRRRGGSDEGGLDARERGNLSKTEKRQAELDEDASCELRNG